MMPYNAPRAREIRPPLVLQTTDRRHPRPRQDTKTAAAVPILMNPYQHVQQIFHAISRTVPQTQRRQVLENTLQFLSHEDVALHDYEVDMGMDRALCLQLGYLDMLLSSASPVNKTTSKNSSLQQSSQVEEEQNLICWCLTRIYQCSRERRLRSFQEMGQADLVPILVKILKRYTATTTTALSLFPTHRPSDRTTQQPSVNFNIVLPVLQLFRIFAKLDAHAKSSLLRWKDGRLLDVLMDLLQPQCNQEASSSSSSEHCIYTQQHSVVVEAFGVLKDMSFRLQDSDKEYMYTRLSNFFLQSINRPNLITTDSSLREKRLETLSAMYWNFATSPKLSLQMGHAPAVLKSLGYLLQYSGTGDDESVNIKRNALSAFGNVVASLTARGPILAVTADGNSQSKGDTSPALQQQQEWIRPMLFQLLIGESDKDIQRRTMRTIRCLASCSWGRKLLVGGENTASMPTTAKELDSYLTKVLKNDSVYDIPTRIQTCETIGSLTQDPDIMALIGPNLERTLVQTIEYMHSSQHLGGQAGLVAAACRALCLSWEHGSSAGRGSHTPSDSFFACLLSCSKMEPETTHPPVAKLLLKLALKVNKTNDTDMPQHSNELSEGSQGAKQNHLGLSSTSSILSTALLDTISELLQPVGPPFDESRHDALELLQLFLQNDANKRVLAENEGLLTALVGFALVTVQDDKKKSAKRMILQLVPEL